MATPGDSGLYPTTPLEEFKNVTDAAGGDSTLYNLNVFYNVSDASLSESRFWWR
jgi:Amt family ammonium transporter